MSSEHCYRQCPFSRNFPSTLRVMTYRMVNGYSSSLAFAVLKARTPLSICFTRKTWCTYCQAFGYNNCVCTSNTRNKSFHQFPDRLNRKELFKQWIFICDLVGLETDENISLQNQFTTKRLAVRHVLFVKHKECALSQPRKLARAGSVYYAIRHNVQGVMGNFEKMDAAYSRRCCSGVSRFSS